MKPAQLNAKTDEFLLLKYRKTGDESLFAELVRRYERELYRYLKRYMGDGAMAEDTFQTTFLQVHLKCNQFQEGRKLRPWLYRIAINQAIDAMRSNRWRRLSSLDQFKPADDDGAAPFVDTLTGDEPDPLANLEAEERRDWARNAVEQLPPAMREAVELVFFQGMKYREAAEVLSVPVGTVKSRMHAALKKLSEAGAGAGTSMYESEATLVAV